MREEGQSFDKSLLREKQLIDWLTKIINELKFRSKSISATLKRKKKATTKKLACLKKLA